MILCLDVGNTHIFGGVFSGDELRLRFRYDSGNQSTSDQVGIFLRAVLRENGIDSDEINKIAICSVVPNLDYSLRNACRKYFSAEPFLLQAGVKTGLKIKYRNPIEVGADRIANAIAAADKHPDKNLIIIDFGTATTICAITDKREYLGGVIAPGIRLSSDALQSGTAKLSSVEILQPQTIIGRSTAESIQSGLYYGQLGLVKEILQRVQQDQLPKSNTTIIGTGGFAHLYREENLFHEIMPDLALTGLKLALEMN